MRFRESLHHVCVNVPGVDAESVRMIWTGHQGLTSGAFGRCVTTQTGIGGLVGFAYWS